MKRKIFVFTILGVCATMSAWANYPIGTFVAPKGADGTNGTDCRPTETRTRCYGTGSDKCDDSTRSGVKIVTTQCDGSGSTTSYIYDNNCGITVASTTDVHQDNDSNKPVTHKRVTFKNTCTNETLSTTADVPAGCTPTYTTKYINKAANGTYSYNNSSRSENTVGARTTVSGCGTDTTFDTYDGNDGTSFNYMGSFASCSALNSVSNPSQNDAYIVNGDGNGKLCIYNGSSWPTCPSGCAEFTGPAGASNCTDFETSTTAVKHTLRTYSGPSDSTTSSGVTFYATRGKMVLTHKMCNTDLSDTVDNENDPCVPIVAPSGVTCNGTYFECKPQGTYTGNTNYAKYNVCEATTGTTFSSALSNKEDAVCVGTNANSSSVERKKTVSYTAPTGSGTVKTGVGKVVNKSVKCDNSETTISSTPDDCKEIPKPNGVCAENGKVYYKCTQQNDGTEYNLCADGNSVLGAAQSAAEAAVAAVDPCAGNTNSSTIIKTTSTTTYSRGTKTSGVYSAIGKKTVTKTACNGDTYTTDEQDDCIEVAKPADVCTAATSAYLRCYNAQAGSDQTYYVCQNLGTGNNSLANKIDSAVTQSALESTLGSTYLKPSDTISASQLPSTVVTVGDDATHGLNTLLATKKYVTESGLESAVSSAVTNQINNAGIVTENTLKQNLLTASVMGNCTTSGGTGDNAPTTTCTEGSLMAEIYNQLKNAIDAAGKN